MNTQTQELTWPIIDLLTLENLYKWIKENKLTTKPEKV